MQKHLANIKTIIQREEQKANGAGRETKNKTMETKNNKFTMYMLKH